MPEPATTSSGKLIIYACPTGPLAAQVAAFFGSSLERFGPNSAHAYPPHITLTGFFHDDAAAIPRYVAALESARARAMASRPASPVQIREVVSLDDFHGLLIDSPWLESLTADAIAAAASPTRRDGLRPKTNLHLSLAYGFRPQDGPALATMATALVDVAAPVAWELRLYERLPDGGWLCHASWGLG
ncbi:MAG: 2'-5' RNA ligase family protein [Chloroflexales bacterium]